MDPAAERLEHFEAAWEHIPLIWRYFHPSASSTQDQGPGMWLLGRCTVLYGDPGLLYQAVGHESGTHGMCGMTLVRRLRVVYCTVAVVLPRLFYLDGLPVQYSNTTVRRRTIAALHCTRCIDPIRSRRLGLLAQSPCPRYTRGYCILEVFIMARCCKVGISVTEPLAPASPAPRHGRHQKREQRLPSYRTFVTLRR